MRTPADYRPGAYGCSWPDEGVHVEIFFDRMEHTVEGSLLAALIGHVMAHEIAHVLEGSDEHSGGVMKSRFNRRDMQKMSIAPLSFTATDRILLHDGLRDRQERIAAISGLGPLTTASAELLFHTKSVP